jgi:hypothetical protein
VSQISETTVAVQRVTVRSERPFDDVVAAVYVGLGMVEHFDGLVRRWSAATGREEFDALIEPVAGSTASAPDAGSYAPVTILAMERDAA